MVTDCSGESPFQDSKELKMNYRVSVFQERLSTLNIRYIKSDKLRQTNCNEFLDNCYERRQDKNFLTVYCIMFSLT